MHSYWRGHQLYSYNCLVHQSDVGCCCLYRLQCTSLWIDWLVMYDGRCVAETNPILFWLALFPLVHMHGRPAQCQRFVASTPPVGPEFCGATYLQIASLGAHHRRTAEPALAACPGTCRVQSCRAHVQGLKRPRATVPVVGFHPCCRCAVSTSTPLGVHQPTAGAVLPAVHDRTEGVPDRWRSCLERSSIWRYVCSVAGRLWTALEDNFFSAACYNAAWLFLTLIVVLEMDFLFRPL